MARFLVAASDARLVRPICDAVTTHLTQAGHEAVPFAAKAQNAVRDADAVIAILDDSPAPALAAGLAAARAKPVLGLMVGAGHPALLEILQRHAEVAGPADVKAPLDAFAREVSPFAGRLVRDEVPRLVEEAGHTLRFRKLPKADRARFLKRKVLEEARDLDEAAPADEMEEVSDLLEVLEAFLAERAWDKDELRRVKTGKHARRGGFKEGFVVEAGMAGAEAAPESATGAASRPSTRGTPHPEPTRSDAGTPGARTPRAATDPTPSPAPTQAPTRAPTPATASPHAAIAPDRLVRDVSGRPVVWEAKEEAEDATIDVIADIDGDVRDV